MIYSRPQYYYRLTVIELYESFFRLEKIFTEIYVSRIDENEAKRYMAMRNVYYSTLQVLYQNESRLFFTKRKKPEEKDLRE